MSSEIIYSYIFAHGYLDIINFKSKLIYSFFYISLAFLFHHTINLFPSISIFTMIMLSYIHFIDDIKYIYSNDLKYLPISMFTGTLIGKENTDNWLLFLTKTNLWDNKPIFLINLIFITNILILAFHIKKKTKYHIFIIIISYFIGPISMIVNYMLFHSSLSIYRNYKRKKLNIAIIISGTIFNYIILKSNILLFFNNRFIICLFASILFSHLCFHNFIYH